MEVLELLGCAAFWIAVCDGIDRGAVAGLKARDLVGVGEFELLEELDKLHFLAAVDDRHTVNLEPAPSDTGRIASGVKARRSA